MTSIKFGLSGKINKINDLHICGCFLMVQCDFLIYNVCFIFYTFLINFYLRGAIRGAWGPLGPISHFCHCLTFLLILCVS